MHPAMAARLRPRCKREWKMRFVPTHYLADITAEPYGCSPPRKKPERVNAFRLWNRNQGSSEPQWKLLGRAGLADMLLGLTFELFHRGFSAQADFARTLINADALDRD